MFFQRYKLGGCLCFVFKHPFTYIVFTCFFCGSLMFGIWQILTKQSRSLTLCLKDGHGGSTNLGSLTVRAEETVASRSVIELVLRCSHLDNKDVFSKSVCFKS